MRLGESVPRLRELLGRVELDESLLLGLLRRPVPQRLLELVGDAPEWANRPRVLTAVVMNPRVPRVLALRLVPSLHWRELADVAQSPRVHGGVRVRAEELLREKLPDLRLGERITLGRLATPSVLAPLLQDSDAKVARAALQNPHLREEDLLVALRGDRVPQALIEAAAASRRWSEGYAVRLALVLQTRTPLAIALSQISSLLPGDLRRVSQTPGLTPLLQAAALRVADTRRRRGPS
jgi:hypothetical protein